MDGAQALGKQFELSRCSDAKQTLGLGAESVR